MIHRAMLARRTFAGPRHHRRDELADRRPSLVFALRSGLEGAVHGEERGELVELAFIQVKTIRRHQIANRVLLFQYRCHPHRPPWLSLAATIANPRHTRKSRVRSQSRVLRGILTRSPKSWMLCAFRLAIVSPSVWFARSGCCVVSR